MSTIPTTIWRGAGVCRADQVTFSVAQASWQRLSARQGAKGRRYYDWAVVEIDRERPGRRWFPAEPAHQ